jgi:AraC-like DNA-binding protein
MSMPSAATAAPAVPAVLPPHAVRTRSRRASDLRDAVAAVTPHEVTAMQPDLDGMVGTLAMSHSTLVYVRYGGSVVVEAPPTESRVVATIPLGPMHVTVGAAARGRVHDAGFILARRERTLMRPDPWAGALVLAADAERLAKHQAVVLGDVQAKRAQPTTATLTRACRQAWQAATTLTPDASRDVVGRFMHVVEDQLLTALVMSWGRAPVEAPPRGTARVTYLRDWLETHHGIDISTCDMARELGVSVRQLQYAVLAETGLTPSELLRETRLRHARELLLTSDRETTTVSAVALACGFAHLGRFSAAYATRFGEAPSVTLRGCA